MSLRTTIARRATSLRFPFQPQAVQVTAFLDGRLEYESWRCKLLSLDSCRLTPEALVGAAGLEPAATCLEGMSPSLFGAFSGFTQLLMLLD